MLLDIISLLQLEADPILNSWFRDVKASFTKYTSELQRVIKPIFSIDAGSGSGIGQTEV